MEEHRWNILSDMEDLLRALSRKCGFVNQMSLLQDWTVDREFYCNVFKRLKEVIWARRVDRCRASMWIIVNQQESLQPNSSHKA